MNILNRYENRSRLFWVILGFALIGIIGFLDFLTGYEITISLFYLIPIFLVTWYTGQRLGIVASMMSAIVWLFALISTGKPYSNPAFYVWNTFIELGFFLIFVFLLAIIRRTLEHEQELSQTDYLTGASNSRFFYNSMQMEINRSRRYKHPFTILYFDIDNFKAVNDQFGHIIGDQVLRTIAQETKKHLRNTDILARLGGDEFIVLLPETDQESIRTVLTKINQDILEGMKQNNWPVTFSMGVLTCKTPPDTSDEIVKMVDDLMYSVKRSGKNAIKYSIYSG